MGLTLKTTQDIWFSQTDTADATNKVVISANTELSIDHCTVAGKFLQITLNTPLNGLSQGYIQASGTVLVAQTAQINSILARTDSGGSDNKHEHNPPGGTEPPGGSDH